MVSTWLPQVLSDEDLDTLLPALSGLSSLQLCSLWRLAGSAEAAPLPSGPWLHSVRCLAAGAGTLLSSAAALRGASALQSLAILHAAPLECDWCSSDADALLECLARHPAIRRVYLHATLHQSLSEAGHMVGWACRLNRRRHAKVLQLPRQGEEGLKGMSRCLPGWSPF